VWNGTLSCARYGISHAHDIVAVNVVHLVRFTAHSEQIYLQLMAGKAVILHEYRTLGRIAGAQTTNCVWPAGAQDE